MSANFYDDLLTQEEIELEVKEVKIKLPNGGHLSGKWWGDKSIRPFVCLHGWLDNAGTFDRLIPLLPREFSYLAIDFPGHGRSSWLPNGVSYHAFDFLYVLTYLMKEYNWKKLSIITHSMGANIAFVYSGIFPDRVDMLIAIDGLKPINRQIDDFLDNLRDSLDNFMLADKRNQSSSEPPAYTIDEMVERIHEGSGKSVSHEAAPYLLKRCILPSKKHPGRFFFAKDGRMKHSIGFNLSLSIYVDFAKSIKIPYLVLKNSHTPIIEAKENFESVLKALKESPLFEYYVVDSRSHHVHLTEPEKVAGSISKFILKHKSPKSNL